MKRKAIFLVMMFLAFGFCVGHASTRSDIQNELVSRLYGGKGGHVSCDFDGYTTTAGRHEGIDIAYTNGAAVYAILDGEITNIVNGYEGKNGLSTIAIYYAPLDKTVIYLHSCPASSIYVGQSISSGQMIATQSWRGCSTASGGHTHVEVRNGWATHAHYSSNDVLESDNPYPFWETVLMGGRNPYGFLDGAEGGNGTVRVTGWAKDDDEPDTALEIHVYVGGPAGQGEGHGGFYAGNNSNDVGRHRFDISFQTNLRGSQPIYVYAINVGGGNDNPLLTDAPMTVNINDPDKEPPKISNEKITSVNSSSFTLSATITDNVGLSKVQFPYWHTWNPGPIATWANASGSGNTYSLKVNRDSSKNTYWADFYGWDHQGNGTESRIRAYVNWHTVTFSANYNGGSVSPANKASIKACLINKDTNKETTYYTTYGDLPKPSRTGYSFDGWYTQASGGTKITSTSQVTTSGNHTLYAHWTKTDTEAPKVTGGNLEVLSATKCRFTITATDNIGVDHVDIHTFYGAWTAEGDTIYKGIKSGNNWYYDVPCELGGKDRIMDARVYDAVGNQALNSSGYPIINALLKYVTITLDVDGGECSETNRKVVFARYTIDGKQNFVSTYGKLMQLPNPTKQGYSFEGWYTDPTGGNKITDSTLVTSASNHTLYAQWRELYKLTLPKGLKVIEEEAFMGVPAEIIVVPEGCVEIRALAFMDCKSARKVYIPASVKDISFNAFKGCGALTICAPSGSTAIEFAKDSNMPYEVTGD